MTNENEAPTCGKGLAANSWLAAGLSDVAFALADVLEHHMSAITKGDEASTQERDAYKSLVNKYREIAAQLDAVADEMNGYRDLAMADHNTSVMTSERSINVFEDLIRAKQRLRDMLEERSADDANLLSQMRA